MAVLGLLIVLGLLTGWILLAARDSAAGAERISMAARPRQATSGGGLRAGLSSARSPESLDGEACVNDPPFVLVIGATGMLGRPVVRGLVREGFDVRALVRDFDRARRCLPDACELVPGDLRHITSIQRACDGIGAVYINLAAPMLARAPVWDPERDGTRTIVEVASAAGVEHVVRISSIGVEQAADRWWAASHKADADQIVLKSGLRATILRPTWFMESLATCWYGPLLVAPRVRGALRWIAGDDYARMVASVLRDPGRHDSIEIVQGPEPLTMAAALYRFAAALPRRIRRVTVPRSMIRLGGLVSNKARYLRHLLEMTEREFAEQDAQAVRTNLPEPRMRIEDYVASMLETGDVPRK
jgi:uncharacterized protein YbjT (DUF2867 family)